MPNTVMHDLIICQMKNDVTSQIFSPPFLAVNLFHYLYTESLENRREIFLSSVQSKP